MKRAWIALWSLLMLCGEAAIAAQQPYWLRQVIDQTAATAVEDAASVLILYSTTEAEIYSNATSRSVIRRACKLLKQPPGDAQAEIMHVLITPFTRVVQLQGWLFLPDGRVQQIPRSRFIETQPNATGPFYEDSQFLQLDTSGWPAGTIVAFELEVHKTGWTSYYHSFTFQYEQPVLFAQLSVSLPPNWSLHVAAWRTGSTHFVRSKHRYTWVARDLPYQPHEDLLPPRYSAAREIAVSAYPNSGRADGTFQRWQDVAEWAAENFTAATVLHPDLVHLAAALTQDTRSPLKKLHSLATFVRDQIRYVAVEIGDGRWQPRKAVQTLYNRYGDCKDKTSLLIALLKIAAIPAVPVLANTNFPVMPELPTPLQFNHCLLAVPVAALDGDAAFPNASAGRWLFFDPTDPTTSPGELPTNLYASTVFVCDPAAPQFVELPLRQPASYRRRYTAEARPSADGAIVATVRIVDYGKLAAETVLERRCMPPEKQIDVWRRQLGKDISAQLQIEDYQSGQTADSAWAQFILICRDYLLRTGPFLVLKPQLFQLPVPSKAHIGRNRTHPLSLGPAMQIETDIRWRIPENWRVEVENTLAESVFSAADLYLERAYHDGLLSVRTRLRQKGLTVSPEHALTVRRFLRELSAANNWALVLHRKRTGDAL